MCRTASLCTNSASDGVLLQLQVVIHAGHLQRRLCQPKLYIENNRRLRSAQKTEPAGAQEGAKLKDVPLYLGVDVAEAGDHVVRRVELGLLVRGRREHDGVGVVPGADGEVPGEVGGGLRGGAAAVAGAVAPAAGDDALPDVGDHPHLRDLREVLPGEAPLRAELPVAVGHRGVGARLRVAAHPTRRSHACVHP